MQKNIYDGEKWIWQKQTVEVWRLVVRAFIVNFDIAGNTHCWHKGNNKADNYYKNIYPMNDKQYNAVLERYSAGDDITEELIYEIVNDILYKVDDWYANKWKRTLFGIGYLGCSDSFATRDNYIYSKWANMMQRCYDEETHKLKPYYASCTAEIEWHNFSNYREWHKENALIDGKISQTDYVIYIALVNNLHDGRKVTYEELSNTIGLDELTPNEIGKHIRKLSKERCLIIEKQYTDKGYEWNKYKFINPDDVEEREDKNKDFELKISLMA